MGPILKEALWLACLRGDTQIYFSARSSLPLTEREAYWKDLFKSVSANSLRRNQGPTIPKQEGVF